MGIVDINVNFIFKELKNPRHFALVVGSILVLMGLGLGMFGQLLWGGAALILGALIIFAVLDPKLFREFVRWALRGIAKGLRDIW